MRIGTVKSVSHSYVDTSGATPPTYFGWPYENTSKARVRNLGGWMTIESTLPPLWAVAKPYAERNGLDINWSDPAATFSKLAVITQTPEEFDFPIPALPDNFHYSGPLHDEEGRKQIPFPWGDLKNDRPLIYASLGTYRMILNSAATFRTSSVLNDPNYRNRARGIQTAITRTPGLDIAADTIEQVLERG
jgi:UDP:flavonoid glycosyltransferase YjiC (YdhE family)